jgi:SAM-dependent methyltransferase
MTFLRRLRGLTPQRLLARLRHLEDTVTQLHQLIFLLSAKNPLPPIPPKHLQTRVAGAYYPAFFEHGRGMFQDLELILKKQGLSMFHFDKILDFGCGCGRFMIPMSCLMEPAKLSGTDIDGEAIQWLRSNYPNFHDVDTNAHVPPTKYMDGTFDFVFSVSIFTHLPEDMQHAWLMELARIIKPGGYGIFTTHGEGHFGNLPSSARAQLRDRGFYYHPGNKTEGLPEFYSTSFHTHEYIRREWSRYFEILEIQDRGLGRYQDTILVKKAG